MTLSVRAKGDVRFGYLSLRVHIKMKGNLLTGHWTGLVRWRKCLRVNGLRKYLAYFKNRAKYRGDALTVL
jgi:hypothetical protein